MRAFLFYPDRDDRLVVAFLALALDVDSRLADDVNRAVDRVVEYPDVLEDDAARGFGGFRLGLLRDEAVDVALGRRDIKSAAGYVVDYPQALFDRVDLQQGARVAFGEIVAKDFLTLRGGQTEDPKLVRDEGLADLELLCRLVLCQVVDVDQSCDR